jgi:hypothetical protein
MNPAGAASGGMDWRIHEVSTELVVTEPVGSLSPEDVKKIVALVLDHVRQEQHSAAQRARDTVISDRAYRSDVE